MGELRVLTSKPSPSQQDIIDHLEEVLRMTRDGLVTGVAIAIVTDERGALFRYVGDNIVSLIGSTSLMADALLAEGREGM